MKKLFTLTVVLSLITLAAVSASAGFSSLYVFGDSLSATVDSTLSPSPSYFGQRDSNGRVWVEVLAQRQGLFFDDAKNDSYYDHSSSDVLNDLKSFTAPPDVANALFVLWVCNADTFDAATTLSYNNNYQFTTANILSQANHLQIITKLYSMGVRTLILPNAVDISEIPAFNSGNITGALRAGCIDYNTRFASTINQARALCPGLKIFTPDFYTLLNNVLTNAAYYGLTNALAGGLSIDAINAQNYGFPTAAISGFGTNFVFWDPQDPTAQFHEIIADIVQQMISPVTISKLTTLNSTNQLNVTLNVANLPLGLNGFVDATTNLAQVGGWNAVTNINSSSLTQPIYVVAPPLPVRPQRSIRSVVSQPMHESVMLTP
jgi:phospholipase/lecithinase/hemolysin